ncbi:MAG: serine/threonine protein kinase [bacterium]|nr:serine/threonine protein kinase [bacterium]
MKNIGKYEVVERIGVGGFGEVYKAYDPFIKRNVAVKTCNSDEQEVRNRFFQEAEIAGNLHHRNITTVYDFGIQDTLPYLIQEYLSGEDLDRKIKRRDFLPFPEKLYYMLQIARGMAYAHSKGVIHRDIKPANIRILEDGTAKIMDFGIAKLAQQETGLTQTGMTLGTAAYLAPEQIRGDPVNHRTDVFSFGVLAYELITYGRPFQGEQISAVLYQILNHEPKPIRDNVTNAPPEIVDLINRCLHKEPAQRFESGSELLKELELIQKKGRADRHRDDEEQPPPAAAATVITPARSAAEVSPQSGIVQSRASAPTVTTGQRGLDEIELTSVQQERKPPSVMPLRNPVGPPRSSSTVRNIVILVVLAAAALGAGVWLGNLGNRSTDATPVETGSQEADGEDLGSGTEQSAAPDDEGTEPASSTPSTAQDQGRATPPAEGEAPGAETATPEAPPPPPPEPEPGTLVVPKVEWTDAMTLQVGRRGRSRPLTRRYVLPLKAGNYTVTFKVTGDYEVTKSVQVRIGEGETRTLNSPIAEPGALTVRASLGKPQAQVLVGERILGQSPISKVMTAPGEHRIQILPLSGEGTPLDKQVNVYSGQETILTFDLEAGDIRDRVKPLDE